MKKLKRKMKATPRHSREGGNPSFSPDRIAHVLPSGHGGVDDANQAERASHSYPPVPHSLPTGKGWGKDEKQSSPVPTLTQHRHRQASISAILDAMFGDLTKQDPKHWDQRTYLLIVGMIYERLAIDEAEIETSELVALAKILSECRRADTGAVKQEQKDDSEISPGKQQDKPTGKIDATLQEVYGAGLQSPDGDPEQGATSDTEMSVKEKERADKPNFVPRMRGGDHLSRPTVTCRLKRPTHSQASITDARDGPPHSCLLGLAGGGVCPATTVTGHAVRSYRTISPLPARPRPNIGGIFSVALSLGSRRVGVTNHRTLPSSDFPPERVRNKTQRPSDHLRPLQRVE